MNIHFLIYQIVKIHEKNKNNKKALQRKEDMVV